MWCLDSAAAAWTACFGDGGVWEGLAGDGGHVEGWGAEEDDAAVCCGGLELLEVAFAGWGQLGALADALTPLQGTMDQARLDAITVAIAASVGIEAYIWLQDNAGLNPDQAAASICWNAVTILLGALHTDTPPPAATRQP